jgi:hypothetical protein
MGCIARLGCLILLIVVGCVAYVTSGMWLHKVPGYRSQAPAVTAPAAPRWESLSPAGAERTREALTRLSQPRGPVFATLSGADVASYVFSALAKQMPPSTDSVQAMVVRDRISMRASIKLADIGGVGQLGPLAAMFGDREPVELTGTIHVVRPGLAEFQVQQLKVRELNVPGALIPRLIRQLDHGQRPAGLSDTGLPLPLPPYVGDIRVSNGKITLYKNVG